MRNPAFVLRKMPLFVKGQIAWNKGKHPSEETKRKMSISSKLVGKGKWWKGKKRSLETRRKMSLAKNGEKCWNWRGGISRWKISGNLKYKLWFSFQYRQWRSDVFTRDDFTCQKCLKRGINLEAHHIKQLLVILRENKIKTLEQALNCEELWNINNGITLCRDCHKKLKQKGGIF